MQQLMRYLNEANAKVDHLEYANHLLEKENSAMQVEMGKIKTIQATEMMGFKRGPLKVKSEQSD